MPLTDYRKITPKAAPPGGLAKRGFWSTVLRGIDRLVLGKQLKQARVCTGSKCNVERIE